MTQITPTLSLRPLQASDAPTLLRALNALLLRAPYSLGLDNDTLAQQLLQSNPSTLYTVRWQRHQRLCAWRAGELEGLIDIGIGLDSESLDLPDYSPLGLLRLLLLPTKTSLVDEVATALLQAAEDFWRQHGVGRIKAFHVSTGYPTFQAGHGILPSDWTDQIRVLTAAGYQFSERYYALLRPLDQPLEEVMPLAQMSLVIRGQPGDRYYQPYRQTEGMGTARMTRLVLTEEQRTVQIANLVDLRVAPLWRRRNIGRWFLRRLINDATLQGYHQMLVYVPNRASAAQNLLTQHGFQEQNYRGYTLEKSLTH